MRQWSLILFDIHAEVEDLRKKMMHNYELNNASDSIYEIFPASRLD